MAFPLKPLRLVGALLWLPALPAVAVARGGTTEEPPDGLIQANSEFVCFFLDEVLRQATPENCEETTAQQLLQAYPSFTPMQRAQLQQMQAQWPTFRQQWYSLDESQKAMARARWVELLRERQQQEEQAPLSE